jgi:hypothetical protein
MKERILSGWNFMRVLWLLMGIGITIQAITESNFLMLLPGLYFVFTSLANVGCFAGSCAAGFNSKTGNKKDAITEIEYEEVHSKNN